MLSVLPFVVSLLGVASAVRSDLVVHETRASVNHWIKAARIDSNKVLQMRIGLIQQNLHKLEEMLMSVSHPESPKYAQHYTPMEVVDTFAPSEETISAVTNWLIDSGFSRDRLRLSANKGWIHLNASTYEAENLLNTEYHVYIHSSGAGAHIGCHNYSLPRYLQPHVDFIKPTIHLNYQPAPNALLKRTQAGPGPMGQLSSRNGHKISRTGNSVDNCNKGITPDCLRALYNINYTTRSDNNTFGIVSYSPNTYLDTDLDFFFSNFSVTSVGERPNVTLIDGALIQKNSYQSESEVQRLLLTNSLNLEYGMSLTYPQNVTLLQVGDVYEVAQFDNWLDAVDPSYCGGDDPDNSGKYPDKTPSGFNGSKSCGIIKPPNVISISYVVDEVLYSFPYANRQCSEYGKLGTMGTSVIYSSGSHGVAGGGANSSASSAHDNCLNSTHQEDYNLNGTIFNPSFPSTCQYVTSVGATQMIPGSTVHDSEEAATFSGGGFSNLFPLSDYQRDAVTNYLNSSSPFSFSPGQFNDSRNARAYPDISANGLHYQVVANGTFYDVAGGSTTIVASIITLINDARIVAGKKPVGFINPAIYSPNFSSAFNDITIGNNPGCGTDGFNATRGWDPVTGLGTPNFEKLMELFLQQP